jgi:hypothetical protein
MLLVIFFSYIFPLAFTYTGIWYSSPIVSTLSLVAGILGWTLFNFLIFKNLIYRVSKVKSRYSHVSDYGKPVKGRIVKNNFIKANKDGSRSLEIDIEFENYSNTIVRTTMLIVDTRPNESRFDEGKEIKLKLNTGNESPAFILEGANTVKQKRIPIIWMVVNIIYAVVVFVVSYKFHSNGYGWRFLSPGYPWVWTPFMNIFIYTALGVLGENGGFLRRKMYGNRTVEEENMLLLYGRKATAKINSANLTGTYINERPEVLFCLNFKDNEGNLQHRNAKRVVPLTELHKTQEESREILYLPNNEKVFDLL